MKYVFFLSMLFVTSIDLDAQNAKKDTVAPVIRIRCGMTQTSNEPLFIIDGVPVELNGLKRIDPAEIETINVLKDVSATALYGCRAINGVIIITTKEKTIRKFEVLDSLNSFIVSNASIQFIPVVQPADTIQLNSNSTGYVETNLLKSFTSYRVIIRKPGYNTLSAIYTSQFSAYPHRFVLQKEIPEEESVSTVFPNPVLKGSFISFTMYVQKSQWLHLRLVSSAGQPVVEKKHYLAEGKNLVRVLIPSRLPPGTYFLQNVIERKKINEQKIVIH
jgi:TonB-dependent SusC/RagA subfamily outer membrane receptor